MLILLDFDIQPETAYSGRSAVDVSQIVGLM